MTSAARDAGRAAVKAAIPEVLAIGPDFLAGRRDADDMAETMVRTVAAYRNNAAPPGHDARLLAAVMQELHTCGSGYLAGRCDSDCVARTMTTIVSEFG